MPGDTTLDPTEPPEDDTERLAALGALAREADTLRESRASESLAPGVPDVWYAPVDEGGNLLVDPETREALDPNAVVTYDDAGNPTYVTLDAPDPSPEEGS